MKAARLMNFNEQLRIVDVDEPTVSGPYDVIVRIGGAGLCRTDLHIIEGVWTEKINVPVPYIPGHENAGWVEAVGDAVTTVAVGDPVVAHPLISDGVCQACRSGDTMYCRNGRFPGLTQDGGFAEYLLTSERALIKLPPELQPRDIAPHADAGITAYHAVKKAAPTLYPGTRVAVIGIGGLGHIGIQALRLLAPAEIIAVDRSPAALELAQDLGADHIVEASEQDPVKAVRELTGGRGVEAVIDFVGEGSAVQDSINMLARGGTYYVVGYGGEIHIPTIDMIMNEFSIVGNIVGTHSELSELMTLAAQGKVSLRTKAYPLDAINEAIDDLQNGRVQGRAVIVP
jgi:NAD+-dependent secondary alcohol dehydrogenase Adh1